MNAFIQSLPDHRVDIGLVLLFLLAVLVILLYLAQVANPTDAHKAKKHVRRRKRFDAGVRLLDQHHGAIEHRRSRIRPLYAEDDDERL